MNQTKEVSVIVSHIVGCRDRGCRSQIQHSFNNVSRYQYWIYIAWGIPKIDVVSAYHLPIQRHFMMEASVQNTTARVLVKGFWVHFLSRGLANAVLWTAYLLLLLETFLISTRKADIYCSASLRVLASNNLLDSFWMFFGVYWTNVAPYLAALFSQTVSKDYLS